MAETPLKPKINSEEAGFEFTSRPIEQPILTASDRQNLTAPTSEGNSEPGFYQSNKWYIWAVVAGMGVIGMLSYFAFRPNLATRPEKANIVLSIDAPETVASGGEVVYKIRVENKDSLKLEDQELEITYPSGFSHISSSPKAQNLSGTIFKIPELLPNQNVAVIIKVKSSGNVNDQKELKAKLNYKLANSSLPFSEESRFSVKLVAAQIALDIIGPQSTNNAQLVTYEISYKNNSMERVGNARIKLQLPDGFAFAAAQPEPDLGNNIWNVPDLEPNAEGKIQLQGSFKDSNPGESKTLGVEFLILSNNGDYFTQNSASIITVLSSLPLLVSQEVLNLSSENAVKPGDELTFSVKYHNNASTAARGVIVQIQLDSKALDFSSIRAEGGIVNNSTITWNASGVSQLENLNPGEQGTVAFGVRVKNPATKDSSKNLQIISSIKIKSDEYETYFPGKQVSLKITSPAELNDRAVFVSGSQPPQAGKSSVYKISLSFKNASNDFTNTQVTAFLPLGAGSFNASSVNAQESGKISFDPSTGKLIWNVGQLPAHTGVFTTARTLEFQVTLNANASQVGQSPTLVKDISFTALDAYTNLQVSGKAEDLSTSDVEDSGYGGGAVID